MPPLTLDDAAGLTRTGDVWLFRGRTAGRPRDPGRDQQPGQPRRHVGGPGGSPAADVARRAGAVAARPVVREPPARRSAARPAGRGDGLGGQSTGSGPGCASSNRRPAAEMEDAVLRTDRAAGRHAVPDHGRARVPLAAGPGAAARLRARAAPPRPAWRRPTAPRCSPPPTRPWGCCPVGAARTGTTRAGSGAATTSGCPAATGCPVRSPSRSGGARGSRRQGAAHRLDLALDRAAGRDARAPGRRRGVGLHDDRQFRVPPPDVRRHAGRRIEPVQHHVGAGQDLAVRAAQQRAGPVAGGCPAGLPGRPEQYATSKPASRNAAKSEISRAGWLSSMSTRGRRPVLGGEYQVRRETRCFMAPSSRTCLPQGSLPGSLPRQGRWSRPGSSVLVAWRRDRPRGQRFLVAAAPR